jgi:hypothetical protein
MAEPNTTEIDKPAELNPEAHIGCQFPSRLAVSGVLQDCLRQLFSSSDNILHPQLKEFYWAPEATEEALKAPFQVIIENYFSVNVSQMGVRPAILIKPGVWQENKLSIGDRALGGTGSDYYKRITGTHTVLVLAKTVAQAELIAREVHGYLSHFGPLLREWMGFSRWEVPAINEPGDMEQNLENIVIQIPVQYEFVYSWTLTPQASRLLRQISVNAIMKNTEINYQLGA